MLVGEEEFRRIAHLSEAILTHLVDAQFSGASESVLDASEDAIHVVLVALELKHGIDDVLQYLRSRNASFLVDVTDEDDRRIAFLGELQDGGRALTNLHQATR